MTDETEETEEAVWLTYAEAAKRVKSTKHTIQLWRRQGMPMEWRVDEIGQRYRVVELDTLLGWWRQKMQDSPVHFYKMRKLAIENGQTPPPVPERFKRRPRRDVPGIAHNHDGTHDSTHLRPSRVSQYPEDAEVTSDRITALLADLPEFHGQAEHAALTAAMEDETPNCDGLEVFTYDRFDDPEQTDMMRGICRSCPLLDLCRAFAVAGEPAAGMWAGMTPAEIRRLGSSEGADRSAA